MPTSPAIVAGFDAEVARNNGYEVIELPDGRQAARSLTTGEIEPNSVSEGDCGSSWMWVRDAGDELARVQIGFTTKTGAVAYTWSYFLRNTRTGWEKSWSGWGTLALRTRWSATHYRQVDDFGYFYGSAHLTATLWTGAICVSSPDPYDYEWID